MSIKLIAIDLDGTLLNPNHQITPNVNQAIQDAKKAGIHVVLCTGRPLMGVQEQLTTLNLTQDENYVITYNGALIQEVLSKHIIAAHYLTYPEFIEIESLARLHQIHLHTIDHDCIYTANTHISPYTIHEAYLTKMPLIYRPVDQMTEELNIVKMMMVADPEHIDQLIQKLPTSLHERFNTVKSSPFYFEILHKQASKGIALKQLTEYLNILPEETMAIGDHENDLSMLEFATHSVAMENAIPIVKETAKYITKSNAEDGVAHAIYNIALN